MTTTQEDGESRFGTVRLWTSLVILSGGLLAVLYALRAAQQYLGIQEFWYGLQSMRVFAVVLAFVAASLLVLHWMQPVDEVIGSTPVATIMIDHLTVPTSCRG